MKLPKSSSKVEAYTSSQPGQAPLVLPIVAYGKGDVNGGRCMIIYNKIRRKIHVQIFLLPSSFPLYLKNYIHVLLMVNRFVESILTCVPISLFYGLAAKAASPVFLATPAGSSRNFVARCHLLRKCSGQLMLIRPQASLLPYDPYLPCPLPRLSWSSPHPISNSQLHVLPHFHLCPIYLVVFKGSY